MTELNIDSFNLAAIDVGSNAARLLIKHVDIDVDGNRSLNKLLFLRIPLRLGMDVFGGNTVRVPPPLCVMRRMARLS